MKTLKESLFDTDLAERSAFRNQPKSRIELYEIILDFVSEVKPNEGDVVDLNWIDTSKITDMSGIFQDAKLIKYDYDLTYWDVSKVTNFSEMFWSCEYFTGKTIEKWNVSKGQDFTHMFYQCHSLNCNFGSWDMKNARLTDFMFEACYEFEGKGLEKWKTSNLTDTHGMFLYCKELNANLSGWDVKNVKDMAFMFDECKSFEGKGLDKWKPQNIVKTKCMFKQCVKLKCNLDSWKPYIKRIQFFDMTNMFVGCPEKSIPDWYQLTL